MNVTETKPRERVSVEIPFIATFRVVYSGQSGITYGLTHAFDPGVTRLGRAPGITGVALDDRHVSRLHAEIDVDIEAGVERVLLTDIGSSNGTYVNGQRISNVELQDGDVVRMGDTLMVYRRDQELSDAPIDALKGSSPAIRAVRCSVELFAQSMATVILLGETGTGKEVVARVLHELSGRPGPFIAVNCSAIPETLAESQLFGHVQGSFTGASSDHRGYFEAASDGTLFLDELGDLPQPIQPKLLRALEESRGMPVGSAREVAFDVRIICATESKLQREIEAASFRGALYARLAEVTLELPPLRERREDVLILLAHFLELPSPKITPRLAEGLLLYEWPFNVRELAKVAQELKLRARGSGLFTLDSIRHRLPDIPVDDGRSAPTPPSRPGDALGPATRRPPADMENTARHEVPAPDPRRARRHAARARRQHLACRPTDRTLAATSLSLARRAQPQARRLPIGVASYFRERHVMRFVRIMMLLPLAFALSFASGCKNKLCDALPVPEKGKALVLEGGRVCKDKGTVMAVDYPDVKTADELQKKYKKALTDSGWKVREGKSKGMFMASKSAKTIILVVMDNKERGVPTAVVTY